MSVRGPSSERFPLPVQHCALQQIQQPTAFQYHALNDQVTLVIADSKMTVQELQRQIPDAALGYADAPF